MAVTKIWAVKDSIERVLNYAKNPEKTTFSDLKAALHYVGSEDKTVMESEKTMFVTGVNCAADTAVQEMIAVQKRFDKATGNVAYHAYQSFKPGEVTAELCHRLGVELAQKMWGDRYQVLVATHFNTGTYLPKKRQYKPLSPEAREAWRRIDQTTAQITLLDHAHLHDLAAVKQFIQTTDAEIALLTDFRESLHGKLRFCRKPEEKVALTAKRDDCTKALAALRKDKKTAEGILSDQPKIKETIQIEERMRQQNTAPNQHRKREYTR